MLSGTPQGKSTKGSNGAATTAVAGAPAPTPAAERPRQAEGWRAGRPVEDPDKTKPWGRITARPSEYLVHMRRGRVLTGSSGQGASCFKWPWDSVSIVPTTVQRLRFTADQVTSEKVGVEVTGLAVYRIAEPLIAFRMLNFSFPERASEKLEELLSEMFVGAVRRLVANLRVEECLTRRKEGIAEELMREIAPVVSGRGRPDDATDGGWGVILDTIEIQDVRVLSPTVFANLQAPYRSELERRARQADQDRDRIVQEGATEAERQVSLARIAAGLEVRRQQKQADEQAELASLATEARLREARARAEIDAARLADAEADARHAAALAAAAREEAIARSRVAIEAARAAFAEAAAAVAEIESRRARGALALELDRARGLREVDNLVTPEAIQLAVAKELPALAAAFQQSFGEVNITSFDGENPLGFVAAALRSLIALAGTALPKPEDQ